MFATMPAPAEEVTGIDFAGVDRVVVEGTGSRLDINAVKAGDKPALRMTKEGWGADFCNANVAYTRSGSTLRIQVSQSGLASLLLGQCNVTVAMELPENLSLAVTQAQTATTINGRMGDIALKGENIVATVSGHVGDLSVDADKVFVTFSGRARSIAINADKAVADLKLTDVSETRSVKIIASQLLANIGLPVDAVLQRNVVAPLAVFSNDFDTTPGATMSVDIHSDLLKGSLYAITGEAHG